MTGNPEADLEARLREHYRHLREQPSAVRTRRRRPPLLTAAACLAVTLVSVGAYVAIRNADQGRPLETGPAAPVEDDAVGRTDPSSATTIKVEAVDTTEAAPATIVSADPATDDDEEGAATDSDSGSTDAVGSPKAPPPGTGPPPADAELSMAYGLWEPGPHDSCSKAVHDSYWVYGPDGKVYPTYHPPIDPATGCTFGHEHGRDPAGSDLADIPFPFGYVNELAMEAGIGHRNEDHVGHKIEWYNDGGYYRDGSPNTTHDERCDVAYKLHMGTHSDDAFANNAHEVFHYARCENGSELIYRAMHQFGQQGNFNMHCDQGAGPTVTVGQADEPEDRVVSGREIPAARCFEDQVLVPEGEQSNWFPFDERWTLYQSVDSAEFGRFSIQFYFFADLPSRYWDGEKLARTVDLCYVTGALQVRDDEFCGPMRATHSEGRVQWDDPASPFNGADREVFMIDIRLDNEAGSNEWYTDINGGVWTTEPFPGSIRQYVGTTPIRAAASYRPDPLRRITFLDDLGIHAPN